MKFIVTGATGMVGAAFVKAAILEGHEVFALVRKNSKNISKIPTSELVTLIEADLDDIDSIIINDDEYDAFYHFAWDYTTREGRNNVEGQEHNVRLCLNAVLLAKRAKCKRFIGAGSQSEYGFVTGQIDENTQLDPQMPYAMAKVSAYWLSKSLCKQLGITHIWGRIFSVYGNNDHEGTLLLYAINSFLRGEKAFFSSGNQMWNYLHEDDAGRMFLELVKKNVKSDVYFIANRVSKPLREYLEILINNFDNNVSYSFDEDSTKEEYGINPNMEKTSLVLQYTPKVSFDDGIRKMIESFQLKNE